MATTISTGTGAGDNFLREFRDSIAALEAEARAAEQQTAAAVMAGLSPSDPQLQHSQHLQHSPPRLPHQRQRERDMGVVHGGPTQAKSQQYHGGGTHGGTHGGTPPQANSQQQLSASSPPGGQGGQRQALEQLRMRRQLARRGNDRDRDRASSTDHKPPLHAVSSGSRAQGRGDTGWSIESNDGLKALFASARDYETEEAAAASRRTEGPAVASHWAGSATSSAHDQSAAAAVAFHWTGSATSAEDTTMAAHSQPAAAAVDGPGTEAATISEDDHEDDHDDDHHDANGGKDGRRRRERRREQERDSAEEETVSEMETDAAAATATAAATAAASETSTKVNPKPTKSKTPKL